MIFGEITTKAVIDYEQIVRNTVKEIGFDAPEKGLDYKTCEVINKLHAQSQEIADSVHAKGQAPEDIGAGDQGHMFGYATDETKELMPLTHSLATGLGYRLTQVRKDGTLPKLRPDGKTQVTIEYEKNDDGSVTPLRVHTIVISTQHDPDYTLEQIQADLHEHVIKPIVPAKYLDADTIYHLNPSGSFVMGGPEGDGGLTGRKIIIDTYGGWGAHGGGAFSGKDPSKVDRSAAYYCRWIAKSLVAAAWCRCHMQSVFRRLSPCMSMLTAQAEPRATLICSRLSTPTSTCVPVCWCVSSTCSSPSTKRLLAMDTSEMLPVKRTPTSPGRSPSPSKLDRSTLKLVNKPVITMKKK